MVVEALSTHLSEAEHDAAQDLSRDAERHWSQWYAAYATARGEGMAEEDARDQAWRYIQQGIRRPCTTGPAKTNLVCSLNDVRKEQ